MLALNVSSDVLDGFTQVEDGLNQSNETVAQRNEDIYRRLEAFNEQNPEKGAVWYNKATEVRHATQQLYDFVDSLKLAIVIKADGDDADVSEIVHRDDLEAASVIMLSPTNNQGEKLRKSIDGYREYISELMTDSVKRMTVEQALSTESVSKSGTIGAQKWEEAKI